MTHTQSAPDWLTQTTYAHRGFHGAGTPENSLTATQSAVEAGLGVECDIQRCADGTPFVFHDWELDRLTGVSGLVADCSALELAKLPLLGTDQTPPTFAAFLQCVAGRAPILIEIKSRPGYDVIPSCEGVLEALQDYAGPHAVMSFDPRIPAWFAANSPATCRGLVGTDSFPNGFEHVWHKPDMIEHSRADFLALDRRDLTAPDLQAWRAAEKPVLSWTIKTKADWRAASPLADALIAEGEALA